MFSDEEIELLRHIVNFYSNHIHSMPHEKRRIVLPGIMNLFDHEGRVKCLKRKLENK